MNKVTAITGLRQEGKTTELVRNFKELLDVLHCEPDMGYRVHFISCALIDDHVPQEYIDKFIEEHSIDTEPLGDENKITVVSNKQDLLTEISDLVDKSDCHIFIDDPDLVLGKSDFDGVSLNTPQIINDLVCKYPNADTEYSMDITYTYLRTN